MENKMLNETANRDSLIQEWEAAQKTLAKAKELEAELRKKVLKDCFDYVDDSRTGTNNLELGNDYKLKAVFKLNHKLDNKDNAVGKALQQMEALSPEGQFIASRIVKWKPELAVSEYNKAPAELKAIIDETLTTKPGMPTLTLVAPKGK